METTESTKPMETTESAKPMETTESTKPMETTESTKPIETTESTKPVETTTTTTTTTTTLPPLSKFPGVFLKLWVTFSGSHYGKFPEKQYRKLHQRFPWVNWVSLVVSGWLTVIPVTCISWHSLTCQGWQISVAMSTWSIIMQEIDGNWVTCVNCLLIHWRGIMRMLIYLSLERNWLSPVRGQLAPRVFRQLHSAMGYSQSLTSNL